jgi:hypothetical protein
MKTLSDVVRRKLVALVGIVFVALALLSTGCSPAALVRSATPAAVKGGAEGIADPQTEANLAKAMESPEMKEAISALTRDVGSAALDTLDEASKSQRMQEIVSRFAAQVTPVLAKSVNGVVDGATRSAISAAMSQATSDTSMAETQKLVSGITDAALASIDARLAGDLRGQIGPALGDAIEHSIAPAIDRAMSNGKVGSIGREMGKNFVLGVNDGLAEVDDTGRSLIDRAINSKPAAFPWYMLLSGILGVATLILLTVVLRESRRTRQLRATLLALAAGLDAGDRQAWSSELVEVLTDGANDERLGQRIAAVMARRHGAGPSIVTPAKNGTNGTAAHS